MFGASRVLAAVTLPSLFSVTVISALTSEPSTGYASLLVLSGTSSLLAVQFANPLFCVAFQQPVTRLIAPPVLAVTTTAITLLAHSGPAGVAGISLRLVFLIALTALIFDRLGALLSKFTDAGYGGQNLSTLILLLLLSGPIWLGQLPAIDPDDVTVNSLPLLASPLAWLSATAGYDVMRSAWFYQHATFGAGRYDYPSFPEVVTACLAIGISLTLAEEWLCRRRRTLKAEKSQ